MRITSKRVLSLFLALLMVFSLFPVSAFAADSGSDTYYVQAGIDANKPDEQLYMSIDAALNAAASNDASDFSIVLKSDIQATETIEFTGGKNIFINSEGGPWRIAYAGQHEIGNATGFIEVGGGAKVTFNSVTLDKGSSSYSSRVLHVSNGGEVVLDNATVTNGELRDPNQNRGGAGIFVEAGGSVTLDNGAVVTRNTVTGGGAGGIYVAENGSLTVNDATIFENTADGNGAGIYVATNGAMTLTEGAVIEGNTSSNGGLGGGIYVEADANASVSGNVSVTGNNAATGNDVFLAEGATLDVAGSTTEAKIGIAAEDEISYRLVSNQVNGYEIAPTRAGDEKGFTLESGSYDIRYMAYNDVPGLYLFDKTLSISFQDVDTLTAITGKDINGESVDFLQAAVPGTTNENGVLTVPDVVAKNAEDGFEFTFTCDMDEFRIPTEDIVEATSNGQPVAFTYTPDFENGTATVTFSKDDLSGLTAPIELTISAEAYHTLTVSMNGPLYELQSSITGLRESPIAVSSTVKQGEALEGSSIKYKITRGGAPLSDVSVQLFQDGTDETAVYTQVTDADGEVEFTGLTSGVAYYPVLVYSKDYRVIDRDVISFKLSVLDGQELDDTCTNTTGEVAYDASMKTAEVKNVGEDGTVTFSLKQSKDTIVFHANPGDATTTPELSYGGLTNSSTVSKTLEASAVKYGDLASASLTGYDFLGWFTEAEGGEQITSDTMVNVSTVVISNAPDCDYEKTLPLYAHFQPHTYTLKFNPGESKTGVKGTVSPATKEITFGEIIGTLPTPVLEGYVFGGWMLKNADSTIATISANDAWTRPYTNGATIELYASWTPKSYTYNFNLNDNTGSTRANLVGTDIDYVDIIFDSPYGDQFEVVAQRSGYKFLGWSLNASGPVLGADDLNQTTKNATLYAIWEPLEYTVRLEMNGGTIANLPGAVYDADTDTWTMKVKFDTVYGELPIPSKADCTYRGYLATAPGWPADAGYGITVNGEILTSLPQYIDHVDAGGITLSAVLEPWFTFSPAPGTFPGRTLLSGT